MYMFADNLLLTQNTSHVEYNFSSLHTYELGRKQFFFWHMEIEVEIEVAGGYGK